MRYITLITFLAAAFVALADVNTDKAMAKIARDTKTYISADVRAATEDEAYSNAMEQLSAKIADYFKTERSGEAMPDAVYLSGLSSIYERMMSKIADNRYRVMLYVRKSDLKPVGGTDNAVVLTRGSGDSYTPVPTETPPPIVRNDTVVRVIERPLDPTLSSISHLRTRDEVVRTMQDLRKGGQIAGAAAFPVGSATDFYVVVISGDSVTAVLHFADGKYYDITTSGEVDITRYSHCTGYWFTLPKHNK